MKRVLQLIALATCTGLTASAQDLAYKIPEKAFTVASIKSEQLFRLTTVKEVNNSLLGKKLLESISQSTKKDYKSIDELGFSLSANSYYYYQLTDSIDYTCVLIPIADLNKVDALLRSSQQPVFEQNGINVSVRPDAKSVVAWNKQFLFLTYGRAKDNFFADSTRAARYGIELAGDPYVDTVEPIEITDSAATATYDEPVIVEAPSPMPDTIPTTVPDDAPPPPVVDFNYNDTYNEGQSYEERQRIKDSVSLLWLTNNALQVFDKKENTPSILNSPGYRRTADPEAVATFWMTDMQSIYSSFLPYTLMKYGYLMRGYGSYNARLYLGKEQMRLTSEIGLDPQKAASYGRICDQKLNKKFLKYVNSDSLIGFMSIAFNTEAYVNEIPSLFHGIYGKYDEEMNIFGEFLSIALDEKAIAKVVKGDALFLLSGLSQKQVSYSSYNYDPETFEYRDTVKTRTETLPDFLYMFSSDDPRIIERLLQYGIKKEKILQDNGVYSLEQSGKMPFNLHFLIKDGIVFIGTSIKDIRQIQSGSFKGNISKEQKALLSKNNFSLFFNPKTLGAGLPASELGDGAEKMRKLLGGAGNLYMTSTGIKDGYVGVDMVADVPKEKENALQYFLDLIEEMGNLK